MAVRNRAKTTTKAKATAQLCWEDVKVGDEIPPVDFNLTVQRMVMSAAFNGDLNPNHIDSAQGKAQGAPDMFLNNVSTLQLWDRVISDWIGNYGRVKKVSFRTTHFHAAGDVIHTHGKVIKKWQENGLNLIEAELANETPRMTGQTGTVVIALPSMTNPTATPRWNAQGVGV